MEGKSSMFHVLTYLSYWFLWQLILWVSWLGNGAAVWSDISLEFSAKVFLDEINI